MKIVVTGSLGNISWPLTEMLVRQGHEVVVVSRKAEKVAQIEALGAQAAIGSMQDVAFLTATFAGADIVYCMETNDHSVFFDPQVDIVAVYTEIGENYRQAIVASGVKRVVHLSSIGAHTDVGNGILRFHYEVERILNSLPSDVAIKFMRPVGFYTNLFRSLQLIKNQGIMVSNYGGDQREPWVSPLDIAEAIAVEMERPFEGRTIHYLASDEVSPNEIAQMLGAAIGKPELKWVAVSDAQMLSNMIAAGMNAQIAQGFVEMQAAQGDGSLYAHYNLHKPEKGRVKFREFAQVFAQAYLQA